MKKTIVAAFSVALIFGACKKSDNAGKGLSADQQSQIVQNYSAILYAGYQDSYDAAVNMQTKIQAFLAAPSEQKLTDAKNAWLAAREPYMQTEFARFYGGPIDEDNGDGLLNSWPLDEGYIDYLAGDSHSHSAYPTFNTSFGIINKKTTYPTIDIDFLVNNNQPDGGTVNGNGDDVSVSAGYHAIEFLLWGQDNTPAADKKAGQRSYKDYLITAEATAPNGDRRATYLTAVTQLLVNNLKTLVDEWKPNTNNYRKTFESNNAAAIANMFNGIGRLAKGELAGERMFVPLTLNAQEQEHSCFSDNTHRDLVLDMQGMVNAYTGKYTRTNGTVISGLGISDYVKSFNETDDAKMRTLLTKAQASLKVINDNKPFDLLIQAGNASGNQIVNTAVLDVSAVADWVSQIAKDLKLSQVNIPDEN
ncbi:imelysin family protein [Pedobacter arcticus]|uniref:imelysin family protein n=1 Tax=Pedobacter arcticus TaxID=752140 RepID=UPI000314E03F|nr:imelysin family protein [Pedobacter arcticus]